jgi:hypothetical protein
MFGSEYERDRLIEVVAGSVVGEWRRSRSGIASTRPAAARASQIAVAPMSAAVYSRTTPTPPI